MTTNAPDTSAAPAPLLIERDVLCIGCGYNLRGLSSEARCPECGAAAWESLRAETTRDLTATDRSWRSVIFAGLLVWVLSLLFNLASDVAYLVNKISPWFGRPTHWLEDMTWAIAVNVSANATLLAAVALLTARHRRWPAAPAWLRWIVRAATLLYVVSLTAGLFLPWGGSGTAEWMWTLGVLAAMVAMAGLFAVLARYAWRGHGGVAALCITTAVLAVLEGVAQTAGFALLALETMSMARGQVPGPAPAWSAPSESLLTLGIAVDTLVSVLALLIIGLLLRALLMARRRGAGV